MNPTILPKTALQVVLPAPLTNFHRFQYLPVEIRLRVLRHYRQSEGERIVHMTFSGTICQLVCLSPAPALLHVSREFRSEALGWYPILQTPPGAPTIYFDIDDDLLFIREDAGGVLTIRSTPNSLLHHIFGTLIPPVVPAVNLSSVKKLAIDFWVIEKAWRDLSPLTTIRSCQQFCVVFADRYCQRAYATNPPRPALPPAYAATTTADAQLMNAGFSQFEIDMMVEQFWRFDPTHPCFRVFSDHVGNVSTFRILAELMGQQGIDPAWSLPPYDFGDSGFLIVGAELGVGALRYDILGLFLFLDYPRALRALMAYPSWLENCGIVNVKHIVHHTDRD